MAATARRTFGEDLRTVDPVSNAGAARGAPIDLVALARRTLGDREAERALLLQFDRLAAQCDALLDRPASAGDALTALNGAARLIGAGAVAAAAENCLHAARAGLRDADAVDALAAAIFSTRRFLRDLLA